jgi:hypothetical protein
LASVSCVRKAGIDTGIEFDILERGEVSKERILEQMEDSFKYQHAGLGQSDTEPTV